MLYASEAMCLSLLECGYASSRSSSFFCKVTAELLVLISKLLSFQLPRTAQELGLKGEKALTNQHYHRTSFSRLSGQRPRAAQADLPKLFPGALKDQRWSGNCIQVHENLEEYLPCTLPWILCLG